MKKRILITGGTGYVGGRICRHLSRLGQYEIVVATRKAELPFSYSEVSLLQINHSLSSYDSYVKGVDCIVHLAALNERECVDSPSEAIEVNVIQSEKWIRAAAHLAVEKFIYFSTVHVYGAPLLGTINEASCPMPFHPYAITHKAAEDYLTFYTRNSTMKGIILRLSNSFGAPVHPNIERWGLAVNDFARQAVEDGKIVLHSSGEQKRDFIPLSTVEQVVEQLLYLDTPETTVTANLAQGSAKSIYEMAQLVAKEGERMLGQPIPIQRKPTVNKPLSDELHIGSEVLEKLNVKNPNVLFESEISSLLEFVKYHFNG